MKIRPRHSGGFLVILLLALGLVGRGSPADASRAVDPALESVQGLPAANLSIEKTDAPDPVDVGGALVYTFAVSNAGPDAATLVQVTDTLPAGAAYLGASGEGWTCGFAVHTVTCTFALLAPGAAPPLTLTLIAPLGEGLIENSAQVSSVESDPDPTDNTSTPTTIVSPLADLSIAKNQSPDPVAPGGEFSCWLDVSNAGPSTASSITVTYTLPPGAAFTSATGSGWSCGHADGIVTCTRSGLAIGAAPAIAITATAPSSDVTLSDTAIVSSATSDPDAANNAVQSASLVAGADLSIAQSEAPDPVNAAAPFSYTVTVTNAGPEAASTLTMTDPLPGGVVFQSMSGTGWTCRLDKRKVICTRSSLAVGATAVVTINVTAPAAGGTIHNKVTIAAASDDPVSGNNTNTETTTVIPIADLSITKTGSPDPVTVGAALTYRLTATNAGPSQAATVTVTDTLPAGVTFQSAVGSNWTCAQASHIVTCTSATIAAHSSRTITITVTAPAVNGILLNAATVAAATLDPDVANNAATAATTVTGETPPADLSITNADAPDPVSVGAPLTYTLNVANAGPGTASAVTVTDTLPAGVTFVSASGSGWSCAHPPGTVACTRASLGVGTAPPIAIVVKAPSTTGPISNTASVSSSNPDPAPANNAASTETLVTRTLDLSIDETDAPDPVPTGQILTATLVVANAGPTDASSISVIDTLPAGATFVGASGSGWQCASASGTVTCTRPVLPPGPAPPIALKVRSPSTPGMITNTALVSAAEFDPHPSDNQVSRDTRVLAPADVHDIAVTKIRPPSSIKLTAAEPSKTVKVIVQIQNRGGHQEVILDRAVLGRLITLNLQSLGDCPAPTPVVDSFKLGKKNKLNVAFNVTFDCANDPLPTIDGAAHGDYLYTASVHREVIDGEADIHPADDLCPRSVDPPYIFDPYPNATIKDKGCGKKKPDGTFGAPVLTDVVVK